jgi:Helix-turn-helix domain
MQIRKGKPPGSGRLARAGVELSREGRVRLAWMDCYRRCRNVAHTCRHFGISRQTFYRWQRLYDPYDLTTLEERSHCPRRRPPADLVFFLRRKGFALAVAVSALGQG